MDRLIELAERCEKATGPDRRLDAEIGAAVRAMPMSDPDAWLSGWPYPFIAAPQFKGAIAAPDKAGGIVCHWDARDYTASLDSATTLAPKGRYAMVLRQAVDACLRDVRHIADAFEQRLPAFICAAALRARSQSTPDILRSDD